MTQAVDFEMLAMAQVDCLDAPSPSECHGQICGLLCGDAARDRIEALVDQWACDGQGRIDQDVVDLLRRLVIESQTALSGIELDFALLLPDDAAPLEARVGGLSEWTQGFLYGLIEAGMDWADAPDPLREVITDFAEIARLRGAGLTDEEDEQAYAELVEYVRVGALLMYAERVRLRDVGGGDPA
ncbi:UPF0149 family protein [Candidatus Macondimonas diazotrophica]|jgi:uncharacterized protein YgfB (UPF0149 family)|uniref:UPF0149 family protein n=1 Tax=Candidatus Macondimonas diazotrophica TaxID=2305248 RepID=A0A4Z0FA00_9GAMM|nr:UPF0149 family protein [Candidatus Macondimonas diazotrophica]NCU00866.1 UPF0149 family protein [Candidatus Macondimonas diazotrophica]TFZ82540.1 UPF0149 family protein [Candidatus Macondimonas diazotrophica]